LTGSTITYTLFLPDGTLKINRGAAEVADQSVYLGEGYYPWEIVDVDTAVKYREEWEVVYPDGRKSTFPKKAKWYVVMEPDADNV
jgi:hypothetical protein